VRCTPGRALAGLHAGEASQCQQCEAGEDQEAELVAAGQLFGVAEAGGGVEAADAAGPADHDADLSSEALRHQLQHRAVAHIPHTCLRSRVSLSATAFDLVSPQGCQPSRYVAATMRNAGEGVWLEEVGVCGGRGGRDRGEGVA